MTDTSSDIHQQPLTSGYALPPEAIAGLAVAAAALLLLVAGGACWCHQRRRHHARNKLTGRRHRHHGATTGGTTTGGRRTKALKSPSGHAPPPPPPQRKISTPNVPSKCPTVAGKSPASPQSPERTLAAAAATDQTPDVGESSRKASVASSSLPQHEVDGSLVQRQDRSDAAAKQLGDLSFSIRHDPERAVLMIMVKRCVNLPARGSVGTTTDPYVKIQLLPGRQQRGKTRVLRNTLSPVYDEEFTFYGIQNDQLKDLTLHFVVLSFDRYSRDDVLGEVVYHISETSSDLCGEALELTRKICPRNVHTGTQSRGELLISISHQPAACRLTVVVLKARNLPKMDITGSSDPYVKINLLCDGQRLTKKKTHVKKRTLNPVFNESFVFDLPEHCHSLDSVRLEFQLLDWDRITKNEVIGRVNLGGGGDVVGGELGGADVVEAGRRMSSAVHHWREVKASPRRQIAEWHKLTE